MKTTLEKIQLISKIAKIVSKVVFVCCIVAAVLCAVGIVLMILGFETIKLGDVTIGALIEKESGVKVDSVGMYVSIGFSIVSLIICAAIAKICEKFFTHELEAGTPFTFALADEMKRAGIMIMIFSLASAVLDGISSAVLDTISEITSKLQGAVATNGSAFGFGILFLILSLVVRYGAECGAAEEKSVDNI